MKHLTILSVMHHMLLLTASLHALLLDMHNPKDGPPMNVTPSDVQCQCVCVLSLDEIYVKYCLMFVDITISKFIPYMLAFIKIRSKHVIIYNILRSQVVNDIDRVSLIVIISAIIYSNTRFFEPISFFFLVFLFKSINLPIHTESHAIQSRCQILTKSVNTSTRKYTCNCKQNTQVSFLLL